MAIDSSVRPLVGRERELTRLEEALDALVAGSLVCVTLEGEPGIGKTRLLATLRARALERGHLVLAGSAAEFERDLPFSVWLDALDGHAAAEELGEYPELAEERYRVHRALRVRLAAMAAERPVVLVLDDLHWADDASLEAIAALMRRGPAAPVLLAGAFRPGQAPPLLSAALAVSTVERIEIGQLGDTAALELLGGRGDAEMLRHGGGNPFYLEQLARGGVALARPAGAAVGGVPAAVAASLTEELSALSEPERALLRGAAIAGEPFEPDVAAEVAGLDPADGLDALDALVENDLVRPTDVPRRFAFRHPLVRRAVYESVPGGSRLAGHARAVEALRARGAPATELAHHVEHAASRGDETAIALLTAAGAEAAARAPAAAARWYEAALRILPAGDPAREVELRVALAAALRSAGELERSRATVLEAIELLPAEAAERRVELTALCAAVEHWLGRHADAHTRLERAWAELPDRSGAAAAALQVELAIDGLYEMDLDGAVQRGRDALGTARTVGDRALHALAASAACLCEAAAGNVAAAREHHADALARVDGLADAELAPRLEALYYLGWAENYLERWPDAIRHVDRGIAIARATGEGRLLVPMMLIKGYPFEFGGRCAEAIELCDAAVEASRVSGNDHYLFWSLFELGWAHYHAGNLDEAIAAGEESAKVGHRMAGGTMPASGGGPGWQLGCARFEAGQVEQAWEIMHALGDDDLAHKIPVERCFDWEILGLVELALGRVESGDAYVRRAEEHAARLGLDVPGACAARGRAAVLLAQGEPVAAAAKAGEAAALADAAGARLVAAFCHALRGRALVAAGERKEAVAVLRHAESELDVCGSHRVRDEMRRELRALGARAAPRTGGAVAALTQREREIAELVRGRHTNREIATTLFLSEKTIESHLRNVFAKLGVRSRADVARAMEDEPAA